MSSHLVSLPLQDTDPAGSQTNFWHTVVMQCQFVLRKQHFGKAQDAFGRTRHEGSIYISRELKHCFNMSSAIFYKYHLGSRGEEGSLCILPVVRHVHVVQYYIVGGEVEISAKYWLTSKRKCLNGQKICVGSLNCKWADTYLTLNPLANKSPHTV